MILPLVLLVAIGFGTAAPQHARGAPPAPDGERRDDAGSGGRRWLASLGDYYTIKNETEYSSCPEGYPSYGRLGDLLTSWSPNQPDVPEGGVIERLQVSEMRDVAMFFLIRMWLCGGGCGLPSVLCVGTWKY